MESLFEEPKFLRFPDPTFFFKSKICKILIEGDDLFTPIFGCCRQNGIGQRGLAFGIATGHDVHHACLLQMNLIGRLEIKSLQLIGDGYGIEALL